MIRTILGVFNPKFLSDAQVEGRYVNACAHFGSALSYIAMGECVGFEKLLAQWEKWEAEYARRGYRTLPSDDLVSYGGYGRPLVGLGVKRRSLEQPVFHARIYREKFLGKVKPVVDLGALMSGKNAGWQQGTYTIPSTKTES